MHIVIIYTYIGLTQFSKYYRYTLSKSDTEPDCRTLFEIEVTHF